MTLGSSDCPNEMVALLQDSAAPPARRIGFAGAHTVEHGSHRPAPFARHAPHVTHRAVHLDHHLGRMTGLLMQAVDVLRHERVHNAPALERHQRAMPGVGRRGPRRMLETAVPGETAHLRIGHVVVDVGEAFGLGVGRPHALGATEVRNAGLGRDPGASERDDARGRVDPPSNHRGCVVHRGCPPALYCLRNSSATSACHLHRALKGAASCLVFRAGNLHAVSSRCR